MLKPTGTDFVEYFASDGREDNQNDREHLYSTMKRAQNCTVPHFTIRDSDGPTLSGPQHTQDGMYRALPRSKHNLLAYRPSQIKQAISGGNVNALKEALNEGEDVNGRDEYGFTPLFQAADEGDMRMVTLLVESGAEVNGCTPSGGSPLYAATSEGHTDVVLYLLDQGADVNHKLCDDTSALHSACAEGHSDLAQILVISGANVNSLDNGGYTPLCYACRKKRILCANHLHSVDHVVLSKCVDL